MPPTDDPAFEIRRYRPGDETRIIELFERTFGRTMGPTESARHWAWEFRARPGGKVAILLAESGGRLAAQYAVVPLALRIDGRDHDTVLSLDTATAAEFRGRGLFPRLANRLYDELAGENYSAVFGFPNRQSAPSFFGKLGWVELAPFPLLFKPLRGAAGTFMRSRGSAGRLAAPLAEAASALIRRRPRPIPPALDFQEVRGFPEDSDDLWERASTGKRVMVVRDRRYLDWRYVQRPESAYRIHAARESGRLVGLVVTLVQDRHTMRSGFLMDVLCEESRPEVAGALVSRAETVMAAEGARVLSALMYPRGVAHQALRRAGFFAIPRRLYPQEIHFGFRPLARGTHEEALREPSNWFITWGDSDIV